jgi:hypothetical protein
MNGRVVLAFVIVQEKKGDSLAASKVWSQWGGWCDRYQSAAANYIINWFTDQVGNGWTVRALDNYYVKFARDT